MCPGSIHISCHNGTPVHFDVEWGNLNSLSNETCDREDRTVLLGLD